MVDNFTNSIFNKISIYSDKRSPINKIKIFIENNDGIRVEFYVVDVLLADNISNNSLGEKMSTPAETITNNYKAVLNLSASAPG